MAHCKCGNKRKVNSKQCAVCERNRNNKKEKHDRNNSNDKQNGGEDEPPNDTTKSSTSQEESSPTTADKSSENESAKVADDTRVYNLIELTVDNLGTNVKEKDLIKLFGLAQTPFLQEKCRVQMNEGDGNSASLFLPEQVAIEVEKLDGAQAFGTNIRIYKPGTDIPELTAAPSFSKVVQTDEKTIAHQYVEVDTAVHNSCYEVRDLSEATVVQAIMTTFGMDDSRTIRKPTRRGDTEWRIETADVEKYSGVKDLILNDVKIAGVQIRTERLTFDVEKGKVMRQKVQKRDDELLITLKDADTFRFRNITDDEIMRKIVQMNVGSVKKALQSQPHRNFPGEYSGNKYFVLQNLKPGDIKKIPQCFEFNDREFGQLRMWLNYAGKQRRCRFCGDFHDGQCPVEEMVRKLEEERDHAKEEHSGFPIKMYGDSTLRQVQQTSLTSNVDAMPGASLGNLLNAQEIDPESSSVPNVIFVAGQNTLNKRISPEEMMWSEKKTADRLASLSESKKIAILQPPPQNFFLPEEKAKEEAFRGILAALEKHPNIHVWEHPCNLDVASNEFAWHPDDTETNTMLKYMNEKASECFGQPLFLPSTTDEVLTTKRGYVKVNQLYKYGCAGCNSKEKNKWFHLCDTCKDEATKDQWVVEAMQKYEQRVAEIRDEETPELNGGNETREPSEGQELRCPVCTLALTNASDFSTHMKHNHPEKERKNDPRSVYEKSKYGI